VSDYERGPEWFIPMESASGDPRASAEVVSVDVPNGRVVIESYGSAPHPGVFEILPPSRMVVVHEDRVVVYKPAAVGPSTGILSSLEWAFSQHWNREDFFPTPLRERRRLRRAAIREGRFFPGQRNFGK